MNNPKDKAKELFRSFRFAIGITLNSPQEAHDVSKQCALICVEEMVKALRLEYQYCPFEQCTTGIFWLQVKSEIEKL